MMSLKNRPINRCRLWYGSPSLNLIPLMPILSILTVLAVGAAGMAPNEPDLSAHRNRGSAYFENEDYQSAIDHFRRCTQLAPKSAGDLVNLGLAYFKMGDNDSATVVLRRAQQLDPRMLQIYYTLGLIYKKLNNHEQAKEAFEKLLTYDPGDATTHYQLGLMCRKLGMDKRARSAFQAAVRHNPSHPSAHYYLFSYAKAAGRRDEARRELLTFEKMQREIPDKQRTEDAFEAGQYLTLVTVPVQSFFSNATTNRDSIHFVDVTEQVGLVRQGPLLPLRGGAIRLEDFNLDGHQDILLIRFNPEPARWSSQLYHNTGNGRFVDSHDNSYQFDTAQILNAVTGDVNNDGVPDACLITNTGVRLAIGDSSGSFSEVGLTTSDIGDSLAALLSGGVLFDYDHDGDLDLLLLNYVTTSPATTSDSVRTRDQRPDWRNYLYRNHGDANFRAVPDSLWDEDRRFSKTVNAEFGDFDNDEDTDVLLVNEDFPTQLYLNERRGRLRATNPFEFTAATAGVSGDLDNDGHLDVLLAGKSDMVLFKNDGTGTFTPLDLPALQRWKGDGRPSALELFDFDNDGLLDVLLALEDGRLGLFANNGSARFSVFSNTLLAEGQSQSPLVDLETADIDRDGDLDILGIRAEGAPFVLENRGGESTHWIKVEPLGVRVPRFGVGAKIELKAGPYYQRRECVKWPVHFGLGSIDRIDVLRITWPNGIVQNEVGLKADSTYRIEEIVRSDASCPFLYTFTGDKFIYVNDILGVAAMGVPLGEGLYHTPDPDEFVKIDGPLLEPSDGKYMLRLAEELKEVTYLDQVRLYVIDHPSDIDIYPNERFSEPPFAEAGIHTVRSKLYPVSAFDHNGRDVLSLIAREDFRYPADFEYTGYDGLVEPHWLEISLGDLSGSDRIMLFLTGWIYWSSASVNVAVSQNEQQTFETVSLSVPDKQATWNIIYKDIGLPNGKNSTLTVDLSGKFPTNDFRVRISTNMVVYWDEVFFTVNEMQATLRQQEAKLVNSHLHFRGFSDMKRDSVGRENFDYHSVSRYGAWRQHAGPYTRYGKVDDLLVSVDDRYVVFGPGEEIALEFDAAGLKPPPEDWSRDFLFYVFGWIKDGDPNTAFSQTVEPLPFRALSSYPYTDSLEINAGSIFRELSNYLTRSAIETVRTLR